MKVYPRFRDVKFSFPLTETKRKEIEKASAINAGVIYDHEHLEYLVSNYKRFATRKDYRMHNLYNTTRFWHDDVSKEYLENFDKKCGAVKSNSWLLQYHKGAYANLHRDPSNAVTLVTLLSSPKDSIGGENIIITNHERGLSSAKKVVTTDKTLLESPMSTVWHDKIDGGIPNVIRMEKFDTVVYTGRTSHGVSELTDGKRLVMVHWMYFE